MFYRKHICGNKLKLTVEGDLRQTKYETNKNTIKILQHFKIKPI